MHWDRKLVAAKVETSYGVDAEPTGIANAILAERVNLNPMEGTDFARTYESPTMGARGTIPVGLYQTLSFGVELTPSGTPGVAPWWDPLIRACGFARTIAANTSVTYTRVSEDHESATITVNLDGIFYRLRGARGTGKMMWEVLKGPMLDFTFSGIWERALDQAIPPYNLGSQIDLKPQPVSTAQTSLTWAGVAMETKSISLDFGSTVSPSFAIGREEIVLSDISEVIEAQVRAVDLATFDPYELAYEQTGIPVILQHGTGAGRIMRLEAPKVQLMRPGAPTEGDGLVEWGLRGAPLHTAGDDQFTFTLT